MQSVIPTRIRSAVLKLHRMGLRVHGGPSFHICLARRRRIHYQRRAAAAGFKSPVFNFETKLGQKKLARNAGVRFAEILQGPFDSVREFSIDDLPEQFVIKPNWGAGAYGVLLLRKNGNDLIDVRTGGRFGNPGDLSDELFSGNRSAGHKLIAEELIFDHGLPCDFKLYCFYGVVGMIAQISRKREGGKSFKFYSPSGDNLGKVRRDLKVEIDEELPPPKDVESLRDAAEKISRTVRTPFLRVDLYEDKNGVCFGEIALRPGGDQLYVAELDRRLGEMWEDAEGRLMVDGCGDYIA